MSTPQNSGRKYHTPRRTTRPRTRAPIVRATSPNAPRYTRASLIGRIPEHAWASELTSGKKPLRTWLSCSGFPLSNSGCMYPPASLPRTSLRKPYRLSCRWKLEYLFSAGKDGGARAAGFDANSNETTAERAPTDCTYVALARERCECNPSQDSIMKKIE